MNSLTKLPTWQALEAHYQKVRGQHLRTLFADDPKRVERFSVEAAGIYCDFSKHRMTDETMSLLLQLAQESGLQARIAAMFKGEKINVTEQRAVMHVALRAPGVNPCLWMVQTSYPRFMPFSTGWRPSPTGCAAANGKGIRAKPFAIS